jgi:hypothetical protein
MKSWSVLKKYKEINPSLIKSKLQNCAKFKRNRNDSTRENFRQFISVPHYLMILLTNSIVSEKVENPPS